MALSKVDPNSFDVNSIGQYGGRRNLIINGAMQIWQRGTSFNQVDYDFTADRWFGYQNGAGQMDISRDSNTPNDSFQYSLKVSIDTADTDVTGSDFGGIAQTIEAGMIAPTMFGTSDAKNLSLSFWVRSSVTGTYGIALRQPNTTVDSYIAEYTIDSADTWEYKTISITGDTGNNWSLTGAGKGMELNFGLWNGGTYGSSTTHTWLSDNNRIGSSNQVNLASSTSNTFYITGVQLEVSENPTPFEHIPWFIELKQWCYRYYYGIGRVTAGGREGYQTAQTSVYSGMRLVGGSAQSDMSAGCSACYSMYYTTAWNTGTGSTIAGFSSTTSDANLILGFQHDGSSTGSTYNGVPTAIFAEGVYVDSEFSI
jgi:hypothetical protein